jgi:hypothetical protein
MRLRLLVCAVSGLLLCSSSRAQEECEADDSAEVSIPWCDPLVIGGAFGDLRYDPELEKALGMEIRILNAECGDQATVQFGIGERSESNWSRVLLADVVWTWSLWPLHTAWPDLVPNEDTADFWFTIPAGTGYAGEFYGVIYRDRLDGIFRSATGEERRVSLPRLTGDEAR